MSPVILLLALLLGPSSLTADSIRLQDGSVLVADEIGVEGDVVRVRLGEFVFLLPTAGIVLLDAPEVRQDLLDAAAGLASTDPAARRLAVEALSAIDAPEARGAVQTALQDVAPEVRAEAVRTLREDEGRLPTERILEMIQQETESGVRLAAIDALAARGGDAARDWLGALVEDPEAAVRQAARAALRRLVEQR
jgi:HEAT repeat protein